MRMNINHNNGKKVMAEPPRRSYSGQSFSSLSSQGSGGSSGLRRKKSEHELVRSKNRRRLSHCQSVPESLHRNNNVDDGEDHRESGISRKRLSAFDLTRKACKGASSAARLVSRGNGKGGLDRSCLSTKNEEWDDPTEWDDSNDVANVDSKIDPNDVAKVPCGIITLRPPRSAMKGGRTPLRSYLERNVNFDPGQPEMIPPAPHRDDDDDISPWYAPADNDRFLQDAVSCSEKVRRLMKYAASNEACYKSSIGLTSPQVLKEYLSSPQEIVGIEHLLAGQDEARESLKRYHRKDLMGEVARQRTRGGGRGAPIDPEQLAERLRNNTRISSHMARERASYVALLE